MRITYSNLKNQYFRNIGVMSNDPNITNVNAEFNQALGARYQMILAKMADYRTQKQYTDVTVAAQQFYSYPVGLVNFESVVVAVGSVNSPLTVVNSQFGWDILNAIPAIQISAIPQYILPRNDDYGIWPIPQDVYNITFNYHWRDRNLTVADYTDGTIAVTNGSASIVGTNTVFTKAMVGRWFCITDPTEPGQGYWYRVLTFTDTTHLVLSRSYQGTTGSAFTYVIGETPEIPEELHMSLVHGATADFYANMKNDEATAARWENRFWTGDPSNGTRTFGDNTAIGGVIGAMNKYEDRNETHLVNRNPHPDPLGYNKVFAIKLS